jgi:hypothetical protein
LKACNDDDVHAKANAVNRQTGDVIRHIAGDGCMFVTGRRARRRREELLSMATNARVTL